MIRRSADEGGLECVACALRPDLALLPDGDMTEVGEKGITVSDAISSDGTLFIKKFPALL